MTEYRTPARLFHWIVALLVLATIPVGQVMIQEGLSRPVQDSLFIFHKNVGVLILLIVLARLAYRQFVPPPPLPPAVPDWQRRIAGLNHAALYALLIFMAVTGYVRVRAGGFPIEALDAMGLPALVPRSEPLEQWAKDAHWWGRIVLVAVIALHILAAIWHGAVRRDGVFSRIWPPVAR